MINRGRCTVIPLLASFPQRLFSHNINYFLRKLLPPCRSFRGGRRCPPRPSLRSGRNVLRRRKAKKRREITPRPASFVRGRFAVAAGGRGLRSAPTASGLPLRCLRWRRVFGCAWSLFGGGDASRWSPSHPPKSLAFGVIFAALGTRQTPPRSRKH